MERLVKFLPLPQTRAIRYGSTIVLVAIFFVFRLAAGEIGDEYPFLFYVTPILVASLLFDRASGFLATGCSALAVATQVDWRDDPVRQLAALILFLVVGSLLAAFVEAMRGALERGLAAQEELRLLLQEQRHRMKNDFATASSLIALQARSQSDLPARAALESAVAKLHVIAESQDHLQIAANNQVVNMKEYIEDICWGLGEALRDVRPIAIRVDSEKVLLDSRRATHIGLIVNELVTNALKHAFPGDRAGTVQVRLIRRRGDLTIVVEDDGVGCPKKPGGGLGARLVALLAQQAGGSARQESAEPGCRVVITIPNAPSMEEQQERALGQTESG